MGVIASLHETVKAYQKNFERFNLDKNIYQHKRE